MAVLFGISLSESEAIGPGSFGPMPRTDVGVDVLRVDPTTPPSGLARCAKGVQTTHRMSRQPRRSLSP